MTNFLKIYDGGSEKAEIISNLDIVISTSRNQIFVLLHTNGNNGIIRLDSEVIESKEFDIQCIVYSLLRLCTTPLRGDFARNFTHDE